MDALAWDNVRWCMVSMGLDELVSGLAYVVPLDQERVTPCHNCDLFPWNGVLSHRLVRSIHLGAQG